MAWPIRVLPATTVLQLCAALSGILRNKKESASVHMLTPWGGADIGSQAPCEDAAEGSGCFNAIMWLNVGVFNKRPSWHPEYDAESLFQDVQAMLNKSGMSHCPKPCATTSVERIALLQDAGAVSMEMPSGSTAKVSGHMLPEANCHDAEKDEFCYRAVRWLKAEGIASHPEWYPALDANSASYEVQDELNRQGRGQCPRPCRSKSSAESEPEQLRSRAEPRAHHEGPMPRSSPSALEPATVMVDCKDADINTTCYAAVQYGLMEGIGKHPDLYPGLTTTATFRDVQENLFLRDRSKCPRPCPEDVLGAQPHLKSVQDQVDKLAKYIGELGKYMSGEWGGVVRRDPPNNESTWMNVEEEPAAGEAQADAPQRLAVPADGEPPRAWAPDQAVPTGAPALADTSEDEQAPVNVSEEQAPSSASGEARAVAQVNVLSPLPTVDMDAEAVHAEDELPSGWGISVDPGSGETYYYNRSTGKRELPIQWESQQEVAQATDANVVQNAPWDVINETVLDNSSQGVADVTAPGILAQEAANADASDNMSQEAAKVTASLSVSQEVANDTASDVLPSLSQEMANVTAGSDSVSQEAANYTASDVSESVSQFATGGAAVDVQATESDANVAEESLPMVGQDGADVRDVGAPTMTVPIPILPWPLPGWRIQPWRYVERTSATAQMPTTTTHVETAAEMDARSRAKVRQEMDATTTAQVETEADMEARIRSEVMKNMAEAKVRPESTTTVHIETAEEIQARIHAKVMQDMESKLRAKAKRQRSRRSPGWMHHVHDRIKAKKEGNIAYQVWTAVEMEATTTAQVETEAEIEARILSEVVADMADAKSQLESSTTAHVETAAEMEARIEDKVIRDMLAAQLQRR